MYYSANSPYLYQKADVFLEPILVIQKDNLRLSALYRSFCEILSAKIKGYEPDTFVYPTVEDGVEGMKFVKHVYKVMLIIIYGLMCFD